MKNEVVNGNCKINYEGKIYRLTPKERSQAYMKYTDKYLVECNELKMQPLCFEQWIETWIYFNNKNKGERK